MSLFEKNGRVKHTTFPAEAREVFDVTGAGDTVIGVLALCLASGATFREGGLSPPTMPRESWWARWVLQP